MEPLPAANPTRPRMRNPVQSGCEIGPREDSGSRPVASECRVSFAGVNTQIDCKPMAGRRVIESFANIQSFMNRYRAAYSGVALDSCAYTEVTTGRPINLGASIAFCQRHGAACDWIASLDVATSVELIEIVLKRYQREASHD